MTYVCRFVRLGRMTHVCRYTPPEYIVVQNGVESIFGVFFRMVNKYKRKTERQSWREDDMRDVIAAVEQEEMG